ncbi:MAG: alpha/beta fold hydrolase [Flavobacteriales bacterium]|nr:alpha/beta fold hydrolase [Flavobacteriales bacterium]
METTTWVVIISVLIITMLLGVFFSFYFLQEKLIFSPIKLPIDYVYPFQSEFEERFYEVEPGIRLNALLFKVKNPKGLIFYIHGNGDNLRYWGDFAHYFTHFEYDVFMYDFRSFGKSNGYIRGERNLQKDAKFLYHELIKEYGEENMVIYGFSIGTGIASRLASKNNPKLLILEAPYYNFIDLVKYHKAYLPADLISKYHFRTNRYLPLVKCPITIFHGTEDRKVPYSSGEKLRDLNPKLHFVPVAGATHSDLQLMDVFQLEMQKILN